MTVARDDLFLAQPPGPRTAARFTCRPAGPRGVAITIEGEIDAANADNLSEFVAARVGEGERLILDCSAVTFFAVEGFSALQRITVMCAQAGATWVLVPSTSVSRVLTLCKREPADRPLRLVR